MPAPDLSEPSGGSVGEATRRRSWTRALLLGCIALLYIVSVPWYRAADAPLRLWLGLPDWVAVALACYVLTALLNSLAWALTDVPDHADSSEGVGIVEREP